MKKGILITGTGRKGFVGRNIADNFKDKYELFTPSSNELDLRDYEAVVKYIDKKKIDYIVHACSSSENILDSDLKMYFNLEKISNNVEKMIYFGSGAEYDKRYDIIMACEDDIGKRMPVDEYGFGKYIMTNHAKLSKNIYCLRLFGIFGKYEDWTKKFISNICCKVIYDLPITIRRECKFDFIYIDDLPDVIEWMLNNDPKYHDYNFTYGKPVFLTELAKMTLRASGKNLNIDVLNLDGFNNEYTSNNNRLTNELKWFKPTNIELAIEKLYKYYYDNREIIDIDIIKHTR